MKKITISRSILLILACIVGIKAYAQDLPKIQEVSLRAPAEIKIDGKATEWNNKYQAHNRATDLFYSVANDDQRLYLVIHADDPSIVKKVIAGGISFTINKSGNKDEKNAPSFTFPVFDKSTRRTIQYKNPNSTAGNPVVAYPDSVIAVNNTNLLIMSKMIRVRGISSVDTLISVYNDQGIKAAMQFDDKMGVTLEIAIDLKLINIQPGNPDKFLYHIQSNGISLTDLGVQSRSPTGGLRVRVGIVTSADVQVLPYTTDFWGTYQLATK